MSPVIRIKRIIVSAVKHELGDNNGGYTCKSPVHLRRWIPTNSRSCVYGPPVKVVALNRLESILLGVQYFDQYNMF